MDGRDALLGRRRSVSQAVLPAAQDRARGRALGAQVDISWRFPTARPCGGLGLHRFAQLPSSERLLLHGRNSTALAALVTCHAAHSHFLIASFPPFLPARQGPCSRAFLTL